VVDPQGEGAAWRSRVAALLDGYDTVASLLLNGFLVGAIAAASVSFVVGTFAIPAGLRLALVWGDRAIAALFALEYALRWWCAPRPWRYPFTPLALLDAAAIVPMVVGSDVLFLRLLRSLRILRLLRFSSSIQLLRQLGRQDLQIPIRVSLALGSFLFVAAGSIYQVEHDLPQTHIRNFLDAFYFTVVTTTTVGFGDITPRSDAGRLVTLSTIAAGVILIPWQVGDLVRQFVKTLQKISDPCLICGLEFHDADARFCKRCGAPLPEIAPMLSRSNESSNSSNSP
jgi:voltage-gated potassium channel